MENRVGMAPLEIDLYLYLSSFAEIYFSPFYYYFY